MGELAGMRCMAATAILFIEPVRVNGLRIGGRNSDSQYHDGTRHRHFFQTCHQMCLPEAVFPAVD